MPLSQHREFAFEQTASKEVWIEDAEERAGFVVPCVVAPGRQESGYKVFLQGFQWLPDRFGTYTEVTDYLGEKLGKEIDLKEVEEKSGF